jgi:hypothetical protein
VLVGKQQYVIVKHHHEVAQLFSVTSSRLAPLVRVEICIAPKTEEGATSELRQVAFGRSDARCARDVRGRSFAVQRAKYENRG